MHCVSLGKTVITSQQGKLLDGDMFVNACFEESSKYCNNHFDMCLLILHHSDVYFS